MASTRGDRAKSNLLIYNESLVDQLLEIHTALKQTDTWQGELHQVTKTRNQSSSTVDGP
ncbi:hypothetical protein [Chroococcidiopsis cubana]|uniref:hypothetical protein n=1 Tax=Chroococcidiopsis cubana TaxID=171392 RepID=UPI002ACE1FC4|nr:hypothetical protein [Chroococcidiopsis cubana]